MGIRCLKSNLTSQGKSLFVSPCPLWLEERAGQVAGGLDYLQQSFYGSRKSKLCWSCYPYAGDGGKNMALWGDCHEGQSQETGRRGTDWGAIVG